MHGTVKRIECFTERGKLKVQALIEDEKNHKLKALLPSREIAALVPKYVLLGENNKANAAILETIQSILKRTTVGRKIRIWSYQGVIYFSFLNWKNVRFFPENP